MRLAQECCPLFTHTSVLVIHRFYIARLGRLRYHYAVNDSQRPPFPDAWRTLHRSPLAAVEADVASSRGLSVEEREKRLIAVCRAAWAVLRSRADFHQAVAFVDPLPTDFAGKWHALVTKRRAQQRGDHGPR